MDTTETKVNPNPTTTNPNAADMATFLGYEDVPLSRPVGDRKSVKVKCLPVRAFAEYAALFALESELFARGSRYAAARRQRQDFRESARAKPRPFYGLVAEE